MDINLSLCGHKTIYTFNTPIKNPDVCGYKQTASPYVDIEPPIQSRDHCQTIQDPDVCRLKHPTFLYVGIKLFILFDTLYLSKWEASRVENFPHFFNVTPPSHLGFCVVFVLVVFNVFNRRHTSGFSTVPLQCHHCICSKSIST